jgi:hypothetical protein
MKSKGFLIFKIKSKDSGAQNIKVFVDDLREMLLDAKLSKEAKNVQLDIETENVKTTINMKLSELRKLMKQAELQQEFVPRILNKYLVDLSQVLSQSESTAIVGRDNEIEKIWFYLSQKTRNNVFLVGEPDVGKTVIAHEVARQISTNECPKEFYDTRILELKVENLLQINSDFIYERILASIIKFLVKNRDKVILYIDKAIYMKTEENLVMMLYNCLRKYHIPMIATLRTEHFNNYFAADDVISKYLNYVYVDEPEMDEIEPIISNHISKLMNQYEIKISKEMIKFGIFTSVLSNSVSANPGNVINVFEKAFLEAKRKDKEEVDKQSILSCYDSYLKLYNNTSTEEKRMIAYHEAGHYVVARMCKNVVDQKIAFVSILPMMDFLGVNWPYTILGKTLNYTKEHYIDNIAIYMGGRIGEKRFTQKDSTGAVADLAAASSLAENMALRDGFSTDSNNKNRSYITSNNKLKDYLFYDEKRKKLDEEIQSYINEGYKLGEDIINKNLKLLEAVAEKLLKEEILTGEELEQLVKDNEKV